MRKIISILLALGVILGLTVAAVPTVGAACGATVVLSDSCAGTTGVTYTINFTIPVTLLAGNDMLSVDFAAGTSLASVTKTDVTVQDVTDGAAFSPAAITVSTTHIEFLVPALTGTLEAGHQVKIIIGKVVNPAADGAKTLNLDYKLSCCAAVVFDCGTYTIKPAISTYSLMVDFGPTYSGIAKNFVPPFKACGQNDTLQAPYPAGFDTEYIGGVWYTKFDLTLVEKVLGCATPCVNATLSFNVTAFPSPSTGAVVSLNISNQLFTLTPAASSGTLATNITLLLGSNITFASLLHFNMVGAYTICFDVKCPGNPEGTCPACTAATGPVSIVNGPVCYPFNVNQWKDAGKIILNEKWNLISLPLVPFDGTLSVLKASLALEALDLDTVDELLSVWNYGPPWVTPTSLADGKSYWVRMSYPNQGNMPYTWWIWGTAKAMPPAAPAAYPMTAAVWNMFGFTSLTDMTLAAYLWNFTPLPLVYGWDNTGSWLTSGWLLKLGASTLNSGQGYWGFFPTGGIVVPP